MKRLLLALIPSLMIAYATQTVYNTISQRQVNQTYQNTTSHQMKVNVSIGYGLPVQNVVVLSDEQSQPSTPTTFASGSSGKIDSLTFFVEPGNYYQVHINGQCTLYSWVEWTQ